MRPDQKHFNFSKPEETMTKAGFLVFLLLSCVVVFVESYGWREFDPLSKLVKGEQRKDVVEMTWTEEFITSPVYVGFHGGLKEADKIQRLPGQPDGVDFDQYSGYVTVDPRKGRALFYYFVESPHEASTKPLVLWLNGGPGCSSLGAGAMMELGPFRVKSDGETLYRNDYAWNNVANIIFLESPAGVGFSYSNTTSDYELSGDVRTAQDSYTFLINWLERFPEYKARDFFIAGESYAGHYVPQLAQLILHKNKKTNQTIINLRGIAIGNGLLDDESDTWGRIDFYWTHFLISDEIKKGIYFNCKSLVGYNESDECFKYKSQVSELIKDIYVYDIYAPFCDSSRKGTLTAIHDPCSEDYIDSYLNNPRVQKALHANVTSLPDPWESCSGEIAYRYKDQPASVLPVIRELMASGISVWLYSGDTDGILPTTNTKYAITKLGTPVKTPWYPWTTDGEVGGYAVEYQNLTFVTVRGAGHFVPSYQPARALTLFSSFLDEKLPPVS